MAKMTPNLWKEIKYFHPDGVDNFGDPYMMEASIIFAIEALRRYTGRAITVHCGYEQRTTGGWHPSGHAVDVDIEDLHVVDQYLAAERFDEFNGIGVYPNWNNPGLHLDTRPNNKTGFDARWGCEKPGVYVPLNWDFFNKL